MKKVLITISILFILIGVILSVYFFARKPVKTSNEAIEIAKKYVTKKYDKDFSKYIIHTEENDDVWVVYYGKPSVYYDNGHIAVVKGGGGPSMKIRKVDGIVYDCYLQK